MYRKTTRILGLAILTALAGTAQAATPSGEMLANTCAGCHGTHGNSHGPGTPTIAGLSEDYLIEAMEEYKEGERPSTVMGRIARGYSDEEIRAMAKYLAQQKFRPAKQSYDKKMAAKGAKLHKKYCEKCHEDNGRSAEDDTSRLAGQWRPYLDFTMQDFLSGEREMPKKMKKKLMSLHEKEGAEGIEKLLHFYSREQ